MTDRKSLREAERLAQKRLPFKKRKRYYESSSDEESEEDRRKETHGREKLRVIGASCSEVIGYKAYSPTSTILVKGLPLHVTENGIREEIYRDGIIPKDVRVVRKKDSGQPRGFGFIEFANVSEAYSYMNKHKGIFVFKKTHRAIMQFSHTDKSSIEASKQAVDWFCTKCAAQNFRKRERCFKCLASRMESEEGGTGSDEISDYVTKTIMLRNLDPLTTVETVREVLNGAIPQLVTKISMMVITVDTVTSISRGICYLGTENLIDSMHLYNALNVVFPTLMIDDRRISVSYCKFRMGDSGDLYEGQVESVAPSESSDAEKFARFYAEKYAKTSSELEYYLTYFRSYYAQQMHQKHLLAAQCALQPLQFYKLPETDIPNGANGKQYPTPDINTYIYDQLTGSFYDPQTGLYYDKNSSYYWNNQIRKYLYWDSEKSTYVLAPETGANQSVVTIEADPVYEEELRNITGISENSTSSSEEFNTVPEPRLVPMYNEIPSKPIEPQSTTSVPAISPKIFKMTWKTGLDLVNDNKDTDEIIDPVGLKSGVIRKSL